MKYGLIGEHLPHSFSKEIHAKIADYTYAERKEDIPIVEDAVNARYDDMMRDFYSYIVGEKQNPYTYEHDYLVQKVLSEIIGGVRFNGTDID